MNTILEKKQNQSFDEEGIDIKKILFQIISNWYWFAISLFATIFIAYLFNRYSEPTFTVSSTLIVREDENARGFTAQENLLKGLNLIRNTKSIQNEIGILGTYSLAQRTIYELGEDFAITYIAVGRRGIKELKLYKSSPFKVDENDSIKLPVGLPIFITIVSKDEYLFEIDGGYSVSQKNKFNQRVELPGIVFNLKYRNPREFNDNLIGKKYYFYQNSFNSLVNQYKSKVYIEQLHAKGSILRLTSSGFVAQQEADYLNKLMEVYIKSNLEDKNRIADNAIRFIDSQLLSMSDSLQRAEIALQQFRLENKILDLSTEGAILFDKLKLLQDQKTENELKIWYIKYLKDYIGQKKDIGDIVAPSTIGVDDIQLNELLMQLNEVHMQYKEQLVSAKPDNPVFKQAEARTENLKKTVTEKLNSMLEAINIAESDIDKRIAQVEKELFKLPLNEQQLIKIERKFNILDKLYTYLLEKRAEAGISKASNVSDNRILDYAMSENARQIKPNKRNNNFIAIILGLAIPSVIILLFNFLNNKVNDLKEIGKYTSTPVLGSVGHNKYSSNIPVFDKPKSTLTESFRAVRTNLQYVLRNPEQKVLTVTSTVSGEGKTFVAANLAAIISMSGKKVLIVGLDLRKPKLQNYFETNSITGLSTYLIGKNSAEEVVFNTSYENVFYVPSGPIPPNPAELIESARMDEFINWAKQKFDYIVLDTPPIAVVTDALLTQRFTDMVLFVVRFNYSHKEVLKLVESLRATGSAKSISMLINDLQQKRIYGYNYGYNYGYSYGYSYGYGNYGYGEKSEGGYYTDDEPPLTWQEKIKRLF